MSHAPLTTLLTVALCALPLGASSIEKRTLQELSQNAAIIGEFRVLSARAAWDSERRVIWTHYELERLAAWKGAPSERLRLAEPGGIVQDVGQRVAGVPTYAVGASYVLFLHKDALDQWRTLGLVQGAFSIQRMADGAPGVRFARGLGHVTEAHFRREDGAPRIGASLAEFRQVVLSLALERGR